MCCLTSASGAASSYIMAMYSLFLFEEQWSRMEMSKPVLRRKQLLRQTYPNPNVSSGTLIHNTTMNYTRLPVPEQQSDN